MRHEQHLFFHRRYRHQLRLVDRQRDEADISRAGADFLQQPLRRAGNQLHFDRGMLPAVLLQQCGEHVHAHGHAAGQPQRAAEHLLAFADERDRFLDVAEDAMAQLNERFAGGGDADAPAHAQEDGLVHLFLEQQNLAADGRLRHAQLPPGGGERPRLGDRLHDLELPQIHRNIISDSGMDFICPIPFRHDSEVQSS